MSDFDPAFDFMIRHECRNIETGDYHCDPEDPGGETKYGISKRSHPSINVEALTLEGAKSIYYISYWSIPGIYQLNDQDVANKVFDLGVNMGTKKAVELLQESLFQFGWPVEVDGILGQGTSKAANTVSREGLLRELKLAAIVHYRELIQKNPVLGKYSRGWMLRACAGPGENPEMVTPA